jgi:hypothetical protein
VTFGASASRRSPPIRIAERCEHAQQQRDFLLARHAAGEDQEPSIGCELELGAKIRIGARRMKDRAVDAERLDRDVRDAEIAEPFRDQPARREHAVEAPIEMAQVAAGEPSDRRREAIREEAREIGVRERDGRNGELVGDAEHDPGQVIRIGGLDHIGLEFAQNARPAIDAERHAIAAGHAQLRKTAELDDAVLAHSIARAGHDERVPKLALRREILPFREEIPLHAARVRREEQGHVDDVHRVVPRLIAGCGVATIARSFDIELSCGGLHHRRPLSRVRVTRV